MLTIKIDWQTILSVDQMWDELVSKSRHPDWHGCNRDALQDGWVTGGLDEFGPPYDFIFENCQAVRPELRQLAIEVMQIAVTSVVENGGSVKCA